MKLTEKRRELLEAVAAGEVEHRWYFSATKSNTDRATHKGKTVTGGVKALVVAGLVRQAQRRLGDVNARYELTDEGRDALRSAQERKELDQNPDEVEVGN